MTAFDSVKKKLIFDEDIVPTTNPSAAAQSNNPFLQILDNSEEASLPKF